MKRFPSNNRAVMAQIDKYLENKSECSMGEVEEELGIPLQKQYLVYRAYRDFFPSIKLKDGRWTWNYKQLGQPVPVTSQDTLSAER
jgi:hypothetical protein